MKKVLNGTFLVLVLLYTITFGLYQMKKTNVCGNVTNYYTEKNNYYATVVYDNNEYSGTIDKVIYDTLVSSKKQYILCITHKSENLVYYIMLFIFYCSITIGYTLFLVFKGD